MADSVHVEKINNNYYCLTVHAESLAEAQSLINLVLAEKSSAAFKPAAPPLSPESQALLSRAENAEVD